MQATTRQEFNKFSTFALSEAETKLAIESIGPETQMWLQNLFSQANHLRLQMEYDHAAPHKFLQEEAYQKGQADALEFILSAIPPFLSILTNPAQEN